MRKRIKVNFGCFDYPCEGWINIDYALRHILINKIPLMPKILYKLGILKKRVYLAHNHGKFNKVKYGDVRKKLRFRDNSIDAINCSHMLEHLYYDEAKKFLKECFRILKDGGIMRISVPDLEKNAKKYVRGIKAKIDSSSIPVFRLLPDLANWPIINYVQPESIRILNKGGN